MNSLNLAELREVTEDNLAMILNWRNQDFVRNMMFSSELISMEQHVKWFNKIKLSETSLSRIFYYDKKPYGVVNFHNIDKLNNTCEWSFYIGEPSAPKGMGTKLGVKALNYIFLEMKIRKLSAKVISYNEKSYFYHQKLGFVQEGYLKNHVIKEEVYRDVILFAQFNHEWEKRSCFI